MAKKRLKRHFERLDQSYLDDLVVKARKGSSNAFAELFTAVADRQLFYLTRLYGNREDAVSALKETFVSALKGLPSLTRPEFFLIWISRMSTVSHLTHTGKEKAENDKFTISQLLNLPLAESQIMMMSCEQRLSDQEIADILNIGKGTVRRFIRLAGRHLKNEAAGADAAELRFSDIAGADGKPGSGQSSGADRVSGRDSEGAAELSPLETAEMLDSIFEQCGCEPNDLPTSALTSYAVYRKERFSLQRGILACALIVFMLLPGLFLIPTLTISENEKGERGLPVVTVDVKSLLPVGRVTASVRDHNLPVYEAAAKEFTIEPIRNGSLTIQVELVNHQKTNYEVEVTEVDSEGPKLIKNDSTEDTFRIIVEDAGIGVDYREIYAVGSSGAIYKPITANEDEGVIFEYPTEAWDIYIPDHIGNTLHLALKLG